MENKSEDKESKKGLLSLISERFSDNTEIKKAKIQADKAEKQSKINLKMADVEYKGSDAYTEQLKNAHEKEIELQKQKEDTKREKISADERIAEAKSEEKKAKSEVKLEHEKMLSSDNYTEQIRVQSETRQKIAEEFANTRQAKFEARKEEKLAEEMRIQSPEYTKQVKEQQKTEREKAELDSQVAQAKIAADLSEITLKEKTKQMQIKADAEINKQRIIEENETERVRIEKQGEAYEKTLEYKHIENESERRTIENERATEQVAYEKKLEQLNLERKEYVTKLLDEEDFTKRSFYQDEIQRIDVLLYDLEFNHNNKLMQLDERSVNITARKDDLPVGIEKKSSNPFKALGSKLKLLGGK